MTWVQLFCRYLIVIDDLWSINAWNRIESALVKNNYTCCTGFPEHVYYMEPLSDLHSRWLFFKREFREISASMLRKCKGVPLAIISIASLLAIKTRHMDTWEKILKSLGSELDTNHNLEWMSHVLNLSYNDLDPELKTCFLYLGTYPEDHEIERDDLLNKWIAEGFIRERINSIEEVLSCQVHDLMLDLIISKCREENFVTIIDGQFISMNEASQARRISHQSGNRDIALAVERMSGPHVRSYISFPAAYCIPPLSKFEHISGFRLKLPKKFGELKHLMTLDISGAYLYPCSQSSDFTSLSSLSGLSFPYLRGVLLINGLSKLRSLRALWNFNIRANSAECVRDLGELTNLRQLSLCGPCPTSHEEILTASLEKLGNSNLSHLVWDRRGEETL
ncbi:hypothetical protein HU200_059488 [Digitaria exilis]|uniref:Disease resistance R13L4/SHOC-2-like LRR domain-containing protein n=1 Tax=Digitaria exilis TaxID=1010633 RepID=A0A835E308_9POAL|nr:hypothetical protein HU200_059488 [Digitaria exilis]